MDANTKIIAATEMLVATRRDLQLIDAHLAHLQQGRSAVSLADDVSSEHRASWLGVVDDLDQNTGIKLGVVSATAANNKIGFENPSTGTIHNQEDAAFVCTGIMVALALVESAAPTAFSKFFEDANSYGAQEFNVLPALRLTDSNTGRALVVGMTVGPTDLARGAVPFSYFSSVRPGLGSNVKNKLFSEFTIPRSGTIKAEVFNLGKPPLEGSATFRACVTLLGYKVFGA